MVESNKRHFNESLSLSLSLFILTDYHKTRNQKPRASARGAILSQSAKGVSPAWPVCSEKEERHLSVAVGYDSHTRVNKNEQLTGTNH